MRRVCSEDYVYKETIQSKSLRRLVFSLTATKSTHQRWDFSFKKKQKTKKNTSSVLWTRQIWVPDNRDFLKGHAGREETLGSPGWDSQKEVMWTPRKSEREENSESSLLVILFWDAEGEENKQIPFPITVLNDDITALRFETLSSCSQHANRELIPFFKLTHKTEKLTIS